MAPAVKLLLFEYMGQGITQTAIDIAKFQLILNPEVVDNTMFFFSTILLLFLGGVENTPGQVSGKRFD